MSWSWSNQPVLWDFYIMFLLVASLKGLCHDSAHVWAVTVADCLWTNRKRVRCTRGNLHNSRFIVREAGVFRTFLFDFIYPIIHIYSLVFLRWMLQLIRIRLTTLSCFQTNIYLRVFLRNHARKPVSDPPTKIICKQTLLISLFTLYKLRNTCK